MTPIQQITRSFLFSLLPDFCTIYEVEKEGNLQGFWLSVATLGGAPSRWIRLTRKLEF